MRTSEDNSDNSGAGGRVPEWCSGMLSTPAGEVPVVRTALTAGDRLGAVRVRLGVGRMAYHVSPGLYAVGKPGADDPVAVTANYKLSFDSLRRELNGRNLWLLVLDTAGINVWCAAGKGTFGTDELVRRIRAVRLEQVVSHRTLLLPQLGAPGVAAHTVNRETGFRVIYGPVRARDLGAFIDRGTTATPEMRTVEFPLRDRLVLIPIELVPALRHFSLFLLLLAVSCLLFAPTEFLRCTALTALPVLGAVLAGAVGVPLLLPWLPPRSFVLKGLLLGILWTVVCGLLLGFTPLRWLAWLLLLPPLAAYYALNFTGATTYTSQSGVKREIARYARPLGGIALLGLVLLLF